MKEDFLHYLWKFQKFKSPILYSQTGAVIQVIHPGQHNDNAGPDFLTATLIIDNQKWAGHIELHIQSSHWYLHQHQYDSNYDNVILHVVWSHDMPVYRENGLEIPVLELKDKVEYELLNRYHKLLLHNQFFIPCENELAQVSDLIFEHWITRMYAERLEEKSHVIEKQLQETQHNWEEVLLLGLAKSFGGTVNSNAFVSMIRSVPFSVIQKCYSDAFTLEALFFGLSGLLDQSIEDSYFVKLKHTYDYIVRKYHLKITEVIRPQFFRLRPASFPTIRLSQLAQLLSSQKHLFSKLVVNKGDLDYYEILNSTTSVYWETHYRFGVTSIYQKKSITKSLQNLILINCVFPLKYMHGKYHGNFSWESLVDTVASIPSEKNKIISGFKKIRSIENSALYAQGIIHLKKKYCDQKKCLQCEIGNHILKR